MATESHSAAASVLPVRSAVVALDPATGRGLRDVVTLPDGSEGITAVLRDGTIVNSLGGVMSSAVEPLAPFVNWLLPDDLHVTRPRGGFQTARPIDDGEEESSP